MAVLKITPNDMMEMCEELNQVNSDTRRIIQRYNKIFDELNSAWIGEEQMRFKSIIADHLQYMEKLTEICDEYSRELSDTVRCYEAAESSLADCVVRNFD